MHCKTTYRYAIVSFISLLSVNIMLNTQPRSSVRSGLKESAYLYHLSKTTVSDLRPKNATYDVTLACPELSFPQTLEKSDSWKDVSGRKDIYLYSAFLGDDQVRIIGIRRTMLQRTLTCHLWYKNETSRKIVMETKPATLDRILGGSGFARRTMHCRLVCRYAMVSFISLITVNIMLNTQPRVSVRSDLKKENTQSAHLSTATASDERQKNVNYDATLACAELQFPQILEKFDSWQDVFGRNDIYLYSAFLDDDKVRLVGIKKRKLEHALTCQLWYKNETSRTIVMETKPAVPASIRGGEGFAFSTTYLVCQTNTTRPPEVVSIVGGANACDSPSNVFQVHRPPTAEPARYNFTICVPPVRDDYPSAHRIVEWIEMNRLLGVQFFTFYNESINSHVAPVFLRYEQQGILEILPWNRPTKQVHYGAQSASMFDCLHRNRQRARYTAFMDVDEFIIPRHPEKLTWADMMAKLPPGCSYSFRSSFFTGNYTDDTDIADGGFVFNKSYVLNHRKRHVIINGHRVRSKIIVRPDEVTMFGVHVTWACKPGHVIRFIEPDVGMVHHYRNEGGRELDAGIKWDNTTLKYKSLLQQRLIGL